jgi:hypothetical protein
MDSRKIVFKETAIVAVGVLVLAAGMVGIFAALGQCSTVVVFSALAGSLLIIANHFFMAVTVSLAADRAQKGDVKQAQASVQISSVVRLILLGGAMVLGIKLGANTLALVLPLLFVRPVLMLAEFFRKKGD